MVRGCGVGKKRQRAPSARGEGERSNLICNVTSTPQGLTLLGMFSSGLLNKEDLDECNVGTLAVPDRCCSSSQLYGGDGYCGDGACLVPDQTRDNEAESSELGM